jgi:hypothetical protein
MRHRDPIDEQAQKQQNSENNQGVANKPYPPPMFGIDTLTTGLLVWIPQFHTTQ